MRGPRSLVLTVKVRMPQLPQLMLAVQETGSQLVALEQNGRKPRRQTHRQTGKKKKATV